MNITPGKAEFVGIFIGDGYIYKKENKIQIGFVGSPKTDLELFEHLKKLIYFEWRKRVKFNIRERGLRMVFRSKEISSFLINELNLPYGKNKCENIFIPEIILQEWNLAKHTIRGIIDTDGSVFVSKKPGIQKYPTIEITTTSKVLAEQLKEILISRNFRLGNIRKSLSKFSKRPAYRVPLYGKENLRRWLKEIGFSNKYKLERAINYIQ